MDSDPLLVLKKDYIAVVFNYKINTSLKYSSAGWIVGPNGTY